MSLELSFDHPYCFSFGPSTPPGYPTEYSYELALAEAASTYAPPAAPKRKRESSHYSRSPSYSQSPGPETPVYSQEPVNGSVKHISTPHKAPIRSHGPLLLPKIRNQDQVDASPTPARPAKRTKTSAAGSWKPGHGRSFTNPETTYVPVLTPEHSRNSSTFCSPISMPEGGIDAQLSYDFNNFRRASSVSSVLDGHAAASFGYPTRRAMPTYIPSSAGIETFTPASYTPASYTYAPREPSPMCNSISFDDFTNDDFGCAEDLALDFDTSQASMPEEPTTSLQAYLTAPNPTPSLVRQLNIQLRETGTKHFWWDIRQIRPWTSFNTQTISCTPGLSDLFNINVPACSLPAPATQRNAQPETEAELLNLYKSFYAEKLNAALVVGMGARHLAMKTIAPSSTNSANEPHFVSNYTDDTSSIVFNRPTGRVVGLVLSFDRWNSSMRVEGNHRKVGYLRGLARLHGAMREHGCRYGFIMTEIELVVARNGSDSTPNFGFLEVHSIPLAECDTTRSRTVSPNADDQEDGEDSLEKVQKMTAMMALFYLHLLAKDVPLTNQPSYSSAIGAPAEGTRRKHLPKDTWMPEPQVAEKREAKRARGWVWPDEAVGRKELGKRGVRYAKC